MKKLLFLLGVLLLLYSCNSQSEISKDFNCENFNFKNLETVNDFKNSFTIKLPKSWKTNLYYDDFQSSIYSADTTKQLTETLLIDVTLINNNITFDESFKLNQEQKNLSKKLIRKASKETTLLKKPSYYTISEGKKGNFDYKVCHIFIKINEQKFIFAKAEVYGDSLVEERLCKAYTLVESIKNIQ